MKQSDRLTEIIVCIDDIEKQQIIFTKEIRRLTKVCRTVFIRFSFQIHAVLNSKICLSLMMKDIKILSLANSVFIGLGSGL